MCASTSNQGGGGRICSSSAVSLDAVADLHDAWQRMFCARQGREIALRDHPALGSRTRPRQPVQKFSALHRRRLDGWRLGWGRPPPRLCRCSGRAVREGRPSAARPGCRRGAVRAKCCFHSGQRRRLRRSRGRVPAGAACCASAERAQPGAPRHHGTRIQPRLCTHRQCVCVLQRQWGSRRRSGAGSINKRRARACSPAAEYLLLPVLEAPQGGGGAAAQHGQVARSHLRAHCRNAPLPERGIRQGLCWRLRLVAEQHLFEPPSKPVQQRPSTARGLLHRPSRRRTLLWVAHDIRRRTSHHLQLRQRVGRGRRGWPCERRRRRRWRPSLLRRGTSRKLPLQDLLALHPRDVTA